MATRERIEELFEELMDDFEDAGIEIPRDRISFDFSRTYRSGGDCRVYGQGTNYERFLVRISIYALEDEEAARGILAHELCHTMKDGMLPGHQHGIAFMQNAKLINDRLGIPVGKHMTDYEMDHCGIRKEIEKRDKALAKRREQNRKKQSRKASRYRFHFSF